jgi:hypothetical protein
MSWVRIPSLTPMKSQARASRRDHGPVPSPPHVRSWEHNRSWILSPRYRDLASCILDPGCAILGPAQAAPPGCTSGCTSRLHLQAARPGRPPSLHLQPARPACTSSPPAQPAPPARPPSLHLQPARPACTSRPPAQPGPPDCTSRPNRNGSWIPDPGAQCAGCTSRRSPPRSATDPRSWIGATRGRATRPSSLATAERGLKRARAQRILNPGFPISVGASRVSWGGSLPQCRQSSPEPGSHP